MKSKLTPTVLLLFLVPALLNYHVERQGFNYLDDGLWLLGARTIAEGGILYRDIFTIYGPVKFYILLPFFWLFGESILALVVLKATFAGCLSIIGFLLSRRFNAGKHAWLIPISVVALGPICPRYVCLIVFTAIYAYRLSSSVHPLKNGLHVGLAWGLIALFGLDMLVSGALIVLGGAVYAHLIRPDQFQNSLRRFVGVLAGLTIMFLLSAIVAAVNGTLYLAFWDTIYCPIAYSSNHIRHNLADSFLPQHELRTVFSNVYTGEILDSVWPGQNWMRAVAVCSMAAIILTAPLLAFFTRRLVREPRVGSLLGLALASWVTFLWRSDLAHVIPAFYGSLLLMVHLLGLLPRNRCPIAVLGFFLVIVILAPFGGERIWLATHANRSSLIYWDRPNAKISIAKDRHHVIERVLESLDSENNGPTIGWPAHPGFVFLSGRPLATPQVTLLSGSIREESSVVRDLRASEPLQLIIGRVAGLAPGARNMQSLAPKIWTHLRTHYFIEHELADGPEGFRVIRHIRKSGYEMDDIPLERRLPGTTQLVRNSQSPPLKPGVVISQVFRVGGLDLHGVVLMIAAKGPLPVLLDMEIEIEELSSVSHSRPLARFHASIPLEQSIQYRNLSFPAVAGTADKTIVMHITANTSPDHEIRLFWHDQSMEEGKRVDYLPNGYALVNRQTVEADIYFVSY